MSETKVKEKIDPIKTQHNKKALLEALEKSLGVITKACQIAKLNRSTFYDYYNNDPKFRKQAIEIDDISLDFTESKMFERIEAGSDTMIIWHLKTKGKKRGYIDSSHIDHTTKGEKIQDLSHLTDEELIKRGKLMQNIEKNESD